MKSGYLIVRCLRCGSISRLELKAIRSSISICPVCVDGEIEYIAAQCTIQVFPEHNTEIADSHSYFSMLTRFSIN